MLSAIICVFIAGCAVRSPEVMMQPVEKDREMGAEATQQVTEQIGTIHDVKITPFLNRIGQRLAGQVAPRRFDYTFQVVDQKESNAFAAPGGYIFVSRGILALANSEAELAGVLAHEIIHVNRRHTAQQLAKQRVPNLLNLPGQIVGRVVHKDLGQLVRMPVNLVGMSFMTAYSRQHELEADQLGQRLMAASGYDPLALSDILGRLEKESELRTGEKRRASFFDTHPTTPKRVSEIKERAGTIEWNMQTGVTQSRAQFLKLLEGLTVGINPANGIFREQRFYHPDMDFFMEFPSKWKTVNTPKTVGAFSPDQDGLIFLGLQGKGTDPEQAAAKFIQGIKDQFGAEPSQSKASKIGKWPAYVVTYSDTSGKEPMNMHFLWVSRDGLMYHMIGIAPERKREDLRKTALSFRRLTTEEKTSIKVTRIKVVEAHGDEGLAQLCKRTNNIWKPKTTALMNGISDQSVLKKGQWVKIAVKQPYKGHSGN